MVAEPLLTLADDVVITATGLVRDHDSTVADPFVTAALMSGVTWSDAVENRSRFDALHRRRLLAWRVAGLATAVPLVHGMSMPIEVGDGTCMSRFALVRHEPHGAGNVDPWLLESGRNRWAVRLSDAGLTHLADPASVAAYRILLGLTGMLDNGDGDASVRGWEPHDRYFASRSRRDLAQPGPPAEPLPGVRNDLPSGRRVALPTPRGPGADEPTLWQAMESRRTRRDLGPDPVSLTALGHLLWRTLRIQQVRPRDPHQPRSYDTVLRPVPSGGAMHATDLWLLVKSVAGLAPGVWRYDALSHELIDIATTGKPAHTAAALVSASGDGASVVGVLTVRHARTSAKYRHWAYALELKDVGVIMHALQLTAPVMGLGVIPWGTGLTDPIARLLGVDVEVDQPIGEFVLGVRP